jgi:hypothetical protein
MIWHYRERNSSILRGGKLRDKHIKERKINLREMALQKCEKWDK